MSADTEDIAPPPAIPPAAPMRIQRLTLTDFRAFPGPAPTRFDLDGKNLLVYGENGAGKSSIFHALKGFFSLKPQSALHTHKNVFSGLPPTDCAVAIKFNDGLPEACWSLQTSSGAINAAPIGGHVLGGAGPIREQHPAAVSGGDNRVIKTALRCACLDYRALLDTNYRQGSDPINLFEIAVNYLLRDYPVTTAGGVQTTIGELWSQVLNAIPRRDTSSAINHINRVRLEFNTAFQSALSVLTPQVNELIRLLGWQDVELKSLQTPVVVYSHTKQNRTIEGQQLTPELTFRGHPLPTPQLFLNEARLSALGLAIYLAGRLACTPTATNDLKLLALDDVLIGLDHSNRLPVLDVLREKFNDWQVVLLTYDRNWFDLARSHLPEIDWKCIEVYEGDPAATAPIPIVRPTQNRPARALLEKANELLKTPYVEASANYARQAFELGLRAACELKKVKMPYRADPKKHQAQDFLEAIKKEIKDGTALANWKAAIQQLETLKNVVMNPYSHPNAPNIPRCEVEKAIQAVETFLDLVAKKQ